GFDPARFEVAQMPDPFASGGRGLFLMQKLMDEVTTESSEDGTTVTLRKRVFDLAGSSGQARTASLQPG
ncbi:MAG: ATP-binding protein, partial [Actinomycetota bacterium]|nr:ATP-binding protein [Actinomycetota bacterium]